MPHSLNIDLAQKLVVVEVTGKLTKDDYETFSPLIEEHILKHGKLRLLFIMNDFEGWTAGAMWNDIKFDFKHYCDIQKLAIIGETKWQESMATFCKPFTSAKVKYFPKDEREQAEAWLMTVE